MGLKELSDKEKRVLSCVAQRGDLPIDAIAKQTGYRPHTVRYCIRRLLDNGVIQLLPYVNIYTLGLCEFGLYFTLSSSCDRQAVLKAVSSSERVAWLAEMGGDFQYAATVFGRHAGDMVEFIAALSEAHGAVFERIQFCARVHGTDFSPAFAGIRKGQASALFVGTGPPVARVDETDHRILQTLFEERTASDHAVARTLGLPASTVTYRLRKLRDKGILPAIYYFVHAERASISKFFIFVYCRSWSAAFHQKFFRFCQANGHIVALLEVVGSWRYEVIVRLEEPALITALVEGIQREFSGFIAHTTYVPYYNEPKVSPYPFKSFELIKSAQQRLQIDS